MKFSLCDIRNEQLLKEGRTDSTLVKMVMSIRRKIAHVGLLIVYVLNSLLLLGICLKSIHT